MHRQSRWTLKFPCHLLTLYIIVSNLKAIKLTVEELQALFLFIQWKESKKRKRLKTLCQLQQFFDSLQYCNGHCRIIFTLTHNEKVSSVRITYRSRLPATTSVSINLDNRTHRWTQSCLSDALSVMHLSNYSRAIRKHWCTNRPYHANQKNYFREGPQ